MIYYKNKNLTLYLGNSKKILQQIPNNSIDTIITSPPYYNLRKYTNSKKEIGQEQEENLYIANLIETFLECKRIIKEDGNIFLNIGNYGLIAEKLLIHLSNFLILQNKIIWNKPNPMPTGGKKLTNSWEYIFHFTIQNDYKFFDLYEETKKKREKKNLKNKKIVVIDASIAYIARIKKNNDITLKRIGNVIETKREGNKKILITNKKNIEYDIKITRNKYSNKFNPLNTLRELINRENKRKIRNVWNIPLQPNLSNHIAPFPEEIAIKCILLSTKKNDIVLDPFIGSGTTAKVALSLERKCIGIDINKDYLNIVKNRCLL